MSCYKLYCGHPSLKRVDRLILLPAHSPTNWLIANPVSRRHTKPRVCLCACPSTLPSSSRPMTPTEGIPLTHVPIIQPQNDIFAALFMLSLAAASTRCLVQPRVGGEGGGRDGRRLLHGRGGNGHRPGEGRSSRGRCGRGPGGSGGRPNGSQGGERGVVGGRVDRQEAADLRRPGKLSFGWWASLRGGTRGRGARGPFTR